MPIKTDPKIAEYNGHKVPKKNSKMHPDSLGFGEIPLWDESWESFTQRVDQHWEEIKKLEGNILVVTHGVVCNYMHEKLLGKKLRNRGRDVPFVGGFKIEI